MSSLLSRTFTIGDVQRMLDVGILAPDEKFELIGGEIVPMSPQQRRHSVMKMRVARWLMSHMRKPLEVGVEMTVRLGETALVEPDVLVTTPQTPGPGYVSIADVILAIEIADTSRDRDLAKADHYRAAGLGELWIVDLRARETLVFRPDGTAARTVPFEEILSPDFDAALHLRMKDLE